MPQASPRTAADRGDDRPIVFDKAIGAAGGDEPVLAIVTIDLAASDQLMEPEAGAVKRLVPPSRPGGGERSAFAVEHSGAVAVGLAIRATNTGEGSLGDRGRLPLAGQVKQPVRGDRRLEIRWG